MSLAAFEHFADGAGDAGYERYGVFFKKFYSLLPDDGRMLLHTIVVPDRRGGRGARLEDDDEPAAVYQLHPEGDLPGRQVAPGSNRSTLLDRRRIQDRALPPDRDELRSDVDAWADALEAHKEEAIALKGREIYDIYMHYLRGCSDLFRDGYTNVCQFTLVK